MATSRLLTQNNIRIEPPSTRHQSWPVFDDRIVDREKKKNATTGLWEPTTDFDQYCELWAEFETFRVQYVLRRNRPIKNGIDDKQTGFIAPFLITRIYTQIVEARQSGNKEKEAELERYHEAQLHVWSQFDMIVDSLASNAFVMRRNQQYGRSSEEYKQALYDLVKN